MKFRSMAPMVVINLILLAALSACTSSGSVDALNSAKNAKKSSPEEIVDLRAYCPKTTILAGTETLRMFPKGVKKDSKNALQKLRYQATIQEVVRECNYVSQTLAMRVGVAGRVINGPTGETGDVELPIRIVVSRGEDVLYTQLHKIKASIVPGRSFATFRFVDEAVNIDKPAKENILIRVGFDEGPYNTP